MIITTLLSSFLLAGAPQDTLPVAQAVVSEPVCLMPVYKTDTADMGGKTLPAEFFTNQNATREYVNRTATTPIFQGDALPSRATKGIYVVKFRVRASRFTKATLHYGKPLPGSTLFADGKKADKTLSLRPGVTELALVCNTDSSRCDTFDISLVGEHVSQLCILDNQDKQPLTLSAMNEGKHYGNVLLSPTGKYLITVYYDMSPEGTAEYWTVLSETKSGDVVWRENGYKNWRWLSDRDEIYYTRTWNKRIQLVYRTPQGAERIVADGLPVESFTLSPSEDYIVYTKRDNARDKSGTLRRLEQPDDRMPDWAERGTLYRYDLRSGINQQITFGRENIKLQDISPDGQRILFAFDRMTPNRMPFDRTTLLEMDMTTGHVDTLLLDTTFVSSACYTADGRSLLITATPDAFGGIGKEIPSGRQSNGFDMRLFRYDKDTNTATPLLRQFNASVDQVIVPHKGNQFYLVATEGYGRSLWRVDALNGQRVRYELPISYVQRASIATLTNEPSCVITGFNGERARDCYLTQLGSKPAVRCQQIGEVRFDSIYKNVSLGTCHDWKFRSSRGDSITGFYYLPADFDATKKYPLIVYYYGGCMPTAKVFEYQYPFTVLAAQGYVVYVVEPSGATGFSQEFASRHVGTWGKESSDDIIEGTKAFCLAHAYIDTARIGCMGASYGGFMTEYLQTRTQMFRTAISHAGISNITSYWGGGYWGYTYGEVAQYGDYPWNNPQLYTRQSPLFNADKIHTPLLLLHGTEDTNVPTTESQQLFTALRILGRPVSYVQVDGENHVVRNPAKVAQWQEAIFAWFAYWLKDEHEWWEELFPNDDFGIGKGH